MAKVTLKVPKLSGFDKSFQNLLTTQCGTLTPILTDEVIPNTKVHLKSAINACLPPLASDTFMRCNLKLEAFFVPSRLLYGGYVSWLCGDKLYNESDAEFYRAGIPQLLANSNMVDPAGHHLLGVGTLSDYLGVRTFSAEPNQSFHFNIMPWLCYHRIYDDWYRNPQVQVPLFGPITTDGATASLYQLPYLYDTSVQFTLADLFPDGKCLGSLRQRNFGFDPFTTALPSAQFGSDKAMAVSMDVPSSTPASFTIAALRAANSLQQFAERHSIAGTRLQDYVKANYGADLSSGVAQRALLLGSAEVPVYSKGIYSNSNFEAAPEGEFHSNNPFSATVGAQYGSAVCTGQVELIKDFTANEPGYIMVLASLVPKVTYSSGIDPMLLRYAGWGASHLNNDDGYRTDMANPILQNVGNEAIDVRVLNGKYYSDVPPVFGYQQRYGFWKFKCDELHGLVRDGQALQSFALQRKLTGTPTIGSAFLEIPKNYLDQISATNQAISGYGCWIDCFHDYKVAMPLSEYSIPSLQDPAYEHGNDVEVTLGGSRL